MPIAPGEINTADSKKRLIVCMFLFFNVCINPEYRSTRVNLILTRIVVLRSFTRRLYGLDYGVESGNN